MEQHIEEGFIVQDFVRKVTVGGRKGVGVGVIEEVVGVGDEMVMLGRAVADVREHPIPCKSMTAVNYH